MTLYKFSWLVLHCWVVAILLFKAHGDGSGISVNFLKTPNSTTRLNSATFLFDVMVDGNEGACSPCSRINITCELDYGTPTDCGGKEASYSGLEDGNHKFEVYITASTRVHCSTYNWIVDTTPPTAHITSPSSVTNALEVPVTISFTEPCTGEDGKQGFRCSSVNACNLLVHGDGQVIPSSLVTLVPTRKYTLLVALYGNVTLEMDNNFCSDTAGNKFTKSQNSTHRISFESPKVTNVMNITPYSEPALPLVTSTIVTTVPFVTSTIVTTTFGITCLAQGMLAVSTASLVSSGATQGLSSSLMSNPSSNLFLSLSHIQFVALSTWLPVQLPTEYYKYAMALEWSIPYLNLPWETPVNQRSKSHHLQIYPNEQRKEVNLEKAANMLRRPKLGTQDEGEMVESCQKQYLDSDVADGWRDFLGLIFWLGVIGGSMILLHSSVILIIKYRWRCTRREYGALTFPRFEIFCIILALPCICKASTGLIRGGEPSGVAVGTLMLGVVFLILLSFFLFLLVGVTFGMLLLYHEDYLDAQEQAKSYLPFRYVILDPVKSGEWSWKYQSKQVYVTILGPLFEGLRGLPRYMLRQGNPQNLSDDIIPFNYELEEVAALEGSLRKKGDGIIASDDKTEDMRPSGGNSKRNGDDIIAFIAYDDETEDKRAPGSNYKGSGDDIIASDDKTEDAREAGGNLQYGDGIITEEPNFRQKLFCIPRTYFILLNTMKQVILAIVGAAYIADEESSTPTIITLSITCFLLIFLVLLKPFISQRRLVVQINSFVSEVVVLTLTLLISVKEFSPRITAKIGTCMVLCPFIADVVQVLDQCYGFYKQIRLLDLPNQKSFLRGLKTAFSLFFSFLLLRKPTGTWDTGNEETGKIGSSAARNRSSTTKDKPGMKQPRKHTKSLSSSSKQASGGPHGPSSTSGNPSIPQPSDFGRY